MNLCFENSMLKFTNLVKNDPEEAETFRKKISSFSKLYAFLSQVIPYQDSDLEKLYTFLKFLKNKLPRINKNSVYNFDSEVQLQYYRIQKISEGSIQLSNGKRIKQDGPKDSGKNISDDESIELSRLIDILNERFGTDFIDADQLFFDQIVSTAMKNTRLQEAAKINPLEKFSLIFSEILEELFIERMELNEEIFDKYMNEEKFQKVIEDFITREVHEKLSKN